jgi:hypothetical protein
MAASILTQLGPNGGDVYHMWDMAYTGNGSLSWIRGRHNIKFGGDVRFATNPVGIYQFFRSMTPGLSRLVLRRLRQSGERAIRQQVVQHSGLQPSSVFHLWKSGQDLDGGASRQRSSAKYGNLN